MILTMLFHTITAYTIRRAQEKSKKALSDTSFFASKIRPVHSIPGSDSNTRFRNICFFREISIWMFCIAYKYLHMLWNLGQIRFIFYTHWINMFQCINEFQYNSKMMQLMYLLFIKVSAELPLCDNVLKSIFHFH